MVTATKKVEQFPPADDADNRTITSQALIKSSHVPVAQLSVLGPSELLVGTLHDGRLQVRSPITVQLTKEGGHVIAEAVEFNEFGFGKNFSEALRDLQRTIVELYLTLEEEQERLGDDLLTVRSNLQDKITRRR